MAQRGSEERMSVSLPVGTDRKQMTKLLSKVALELGFKSVNRPEHGSLGHMLYAIATGKAVVVNLELKPTEDEK